MAGAHERTDHVFQRVDGNGKSDPSAVGIDGGVDANHLTLQIEEGTAAVAGVDRSIRLNEIVVRPCSDGTALGADDAHRYRVTETEWIADRNYVVADAQLL